jgi:hypothetical protein
MLTTIQKQFKEAVKINDILEVENILKIPSFIPSFNSNFALRWSAEHGYIEIVKLLLNDFRIDPSYEFNYPIRTAYEYGQYEITKLLWKKEVVKESLKFHDEDLYIEITKKFTKEKIGNF